MLALEAVEAQLQAIARECERLRRDNVPGYLVLQSLEGIEARVAEVRRGLAPALADLYAFHRVADLVATRMGATLIEGATVDRVVAAVAARQQQATADREHAARVVDALDAYLAGAVERDAVLSLLPGWAATAPAHPLSLHLRSLGVDGALAERGALALADV